MSIQPIFLLSNPRSGSTLVQRVIAAHAGVATVSETWLLLPYLYTFRARGVVAEYPYPLMIDALDDFYKELPAGREDYRQELHDFILRLYEKAAGKDARYFLDKSPPYSLIAHEIMYLFPEAKFIFLWRNPLSVISSLVETWPANRGQWHPNAYREHLFVGLPRLVSAYRSNANRAYSVRFEDLADGNENQWRSLMDYLGIEFEPDALHRFPEINLDGRLGDTTGIKLYSRLNTEPIHKWKKTIKNTLRKEWCRRYLQFLGSERLKVMGYDKDRLIHELDRQPAGTASLLPDLAHLIKEIVEEPVQTRKRPQKIDGPSVVRELLRSSAERSARGDG